eukprot:9490718-Pyramimonas_sp.AAC.1
MDVKGTNVDVKGTNADVKGSLYLDGHVGGGAGEHVAEACVPREAQHRVAVAAFLKGRPRGLLLLL